MEFNNMEDLFNKLNKKNEMNKWIQDPEILRAKLGNVADILPALRQIRERCADDSGDVVLTQEAFESLYNTQIIIINALYNQKLLSEKADEIIDKMQKFVNTYKEKVALLENIVEELRAKATKNK